MVTTAPARPTDLIKKVLDQGKYLDGEVLPNTQNPWRLSATRFLILHLVATKYKRSQPSYVSNKLFGTQGQRTQVSSCLEEIEEQLSDYYSRHPLTVGGVSAEVRAIIESGYFRENIMVTYRLLRVARPLQELPEVKAILGQPCPKCKGPLLLEEDRSINHVDVKCRVCAYRALTLNRDGQPITSSAEIRRPTNR